MPGRLRKQQTQLADMGNILAGSEAKN